MDGNSPSRPLGGESLFYLSSVESMYQLVEAPFLWKNQQSLGSVVSDTVDCHIRLKNSSSSLVRSEALMIE